jgi:hypothetical protein
MNGDTREWHTQIWDFLKICLVHETQAPAEQALWGTHTHDMDSLQSNHVKFQLVNNIKISDTQEAKVILQ